jgi:hypothetical protein
MNKMKEKYKDNTTMYLKGNQIADSQCNSHYIKDNDNNIINPFTSTLPEIILCKIKDSQIIDISTKTKLKQKLKKQLAKEIEEEEPHIHNITHNPYIDWTASIWPIQSKKHNSKLENFQHNLKTKTLITPAITNNEECKVCNTGAKATLTHIFSTCIITKEINQQLTEEIASLTDIPHKIQWWFHNQTGQFYRSHGWELKDGDLGYIPKEVTDWIPRKHLEHVAELVACSRHKIWSSYWKEYHNKEQAQTQHNKTQLNQQTNTIKQTSSQRTITTFFQPKTTKPHNNQV